MADELDGLPEDLKRILRDQSVIVPQDQAVFEAIAKWTNAPSDTPSTLHPEWIKGWQSGYAQAASHRERLEARVDELERALAMALLGLTRAREREAEQDQTDESMGITLALNRHINAVQAALEPLSDESGSDG